MTEHNSLNQSTPFISTVSQDDIDAIIGGYHGAPHHVLGLHPVQFPPQNGSSISIRVFRPLEQQIFTIDLRSGREQEMHRVDPAGFFEALFLQDTEPFAYRLRLVSHDGEVYEIDDPYCYPPLLSDGDLHLHMEGKLLEPYAKLGAQIRTIQVDYSNLVYNSLDYNKIDDIGDDPGLETRLVQGVNFAVWAPNAERVSVIGPFNYWDDRMHAMTCRESGGIWEIFIPDLPQGTPYKYAVKSRHLNYRVDKADPYGFWAEIRPDTASRVWNIDAYEWHDDQWLENRATHQALDRPLNIYEVHLGSWRRVPEDNGYLSYRDLAHQLVAYVQKMGYTHIELLPITEHPLDRSWGYQTVGYFAPTSRFGTPDDFMYFVDLCHQHQIGVILDWVPAHFPRDAHGLAFFDGTHLYEHSDPRLGEHRQWGTKIFNYGRNEVSNFLLGSALFWLKKYHIDGLRVDAVASMLYLDYGREQGDWIPNRYGGRENLEAINFLRRFNEIIHAEVPGALTIAEESTSWPMVTRPAYTGGLGFDLKWNMGWMHDMLDYIEKDPIHRRYHHNQITFSLMYAFSENFMLPFSHDEVVHLKRSMLDKMPGDLWQKFANLRALYAFMLGHPGKKLLFMGSEFGQWREWNEAHSLDWHLLNAPMHQQLQQFVADLNRLYQTQPALYQADFNWEGFQWIDISDVEYSIVSFVRRTSGGTEHLVFVCNFTPVPRLQYRVGLPSLGQYNEIMNSNWHRYGGRTVGNHMNEGDTIFSEPVPWQSCSHSAVLNLPPLGVLVLKFLENC
ncbi:1,4-alpha-glucan branching protein GlgB [Chloroflexi bacterium TSY]|nr:1,4-alpha-glucan branching protein GlgB [Chloroflexi bacterium TSY]